MSPVVPRTPRYRPVGKRWPNVFFRLPPRLRFRARRMTTVALPDAEPSHYPLASGDCFQIEAADWLTMADLYVRTIETLRRHPDLEELPA